MTILQIQNKVLINANLLKKMINGYNALGMNAKYTHLVNVLGSMLLIAIEHRNRDLSKLNQIHLVYIQMNLPLYLVISQPEQIGLHFDIQPLQVCLRCFTGIAILLIQLYALYVFAKEVLNVAQKFYDLLDILIVCSTSLCIIVDLAVIIVFNQIGNGFSLICKVLWTFLIVIVFLKFQFQTQKFKLVLAFVGLILVSDFGFFIYQFRTIPIKSVLVIQTFLVVGIAINQIFKISMLLKPNKKIMTLASDSPNLQLLNAPVYQQKLKIDPQTQVHLHNRRSFCIVIGTSLMISLAFIWDLKESKNGIGQILIIILVQILPLATSWLYLKKKSDQNRKTELSVSSRRSSHIQMINIQS